MEEIELSDMLAALRQQLWVAKLDGKGKDIKFSVEDVELELHLTLTKKADAKGGIKFCVFSIEGGGEISSQATQKIKLKLKPESIDGGTLNLANQTKKSE